MDDIERDFLGTNRDPTTEEADFEEIVRCTGCGYWILEGDEDDEGFCGDCQDLREQI